jgi:hypothetical protein
VRLRKQGRSEFEFARKTPTGADGDGIADRDDARLFMPNEPIRFRIERDPLPADRDGIPPDADARSRRFDFCGDVAPADGFIADRGRPFDAERGFGWTRYRRKIIAVAACWMVPVTR